MAELALSKSSDSAQARSRRGLRAQSGGPSHFFFDSGNGNLLAFFDFPGLDVGPYAEVLGGPHLMAISVEPER